MQTVNVTIRKPLYGSFCYIRDIYLQTAIKRNIPMKVTVLGMGEAIHDPKKWIETGKKLSKVFKDINNPMILYGNYALSPDQIKQIRKEDEQFLMDFDMAMKEFIPEFGNYNHVAVVKLMGELRKMEDEMRDKTRGARSLKQLAIKISMLKKNILFKLRQNQ